MSLEESSHFLPRWEWKGVSGDYKFAFLGCIKRIVPSRWARESEVDVFIISTSRKFSIFSSIVF